MRYSVSDLFRRDRTVITPSTGQEGKGQGGGVPAAKPGRPTTRLLRTRRKRRDLTLLQHSLLPWECGHWELRGKLHMQPFKAVSGHYQPRVV